MKRAIIGLLVLVALGVVLVMRSPASSPRVRPVRGARIELPARALERLVISTTATLDAHTASLRGRVVRDDGHTCPHPTLIVRIGIEGHMLIQRQITGDANGGFELDRLPPGAVDIDAWSAGCLRRHPLELDLAIGEHLDDIRVIAERGASITGTVMQASSTRPIAGVKVEARWLREAHEAITGTDGRFAIHGLPSEEVRLEATHAGYVGNNAVVMPGDPGTDVTLVLSAGRTIRGRVAPATVATITVDVVGLDRPIERQLIFKSVTSDARGNFEFPHVPDGELTFVARDGKGHVGGAGIAANGDVANLVVTMQEQGEATLSLRVVDELDAPVANLRVDLGWEHIDLGRDATTDAEGRVTFPHVPRVVVIVDVVGRQRADGEWRTSITGDDRVHTIVVRSQREGLAIRGRVVDAGGAPAAAIWVRAQPAVGESFDAITGPDGTFAFEHLLDAPYEVTASSPSRDRVAAITAAAGADVVVVLEPRHAALVRVIENGLAVPRYTLECLESEGTWASVYASLHAGRLRGLPAGPLTCLAMSRTGAGIGTVVVGGTTTLDITLAPLASITGQLVGADVADRGIDVTAPGGHTQFESADASGRFVVAGLPAGATTVVIGGIRRAITTTSGARFDLGEIHVP